MTAKKKDEGSDPLKVPLQSQEVREAILQKSSAGIGTAIGTIRAYDVDEKEIPSGDDRGSTTPVAGEFEGDSYEGAAPQGAQAEPAIITTNGTVPVNMIGTPSGPVPISAVEGDPAKGARLIQERLDNDEKELLKTGYAKLSRAKVASMSSAELRAVASDRGYDVGQAGNRQTRIRFNRLQAEDKNFESDEEIEGTDTGAPSDEGQ
jgi:hypothetical protein